MGNNTTIQTSMQLIDNVTPVLNTISQALIITTTNFENLQRVSNMGINFGNVQSTIQDFSDIAAAISATEQLFEQARANMEKPIRTSITPPGNPASNNQNNNSPNPSGNSSQPNNNHNSNPLWQGSNNIQIFNSLGLERFNQELASAQSMANRLASTQASISINSARRYT